MARIFFPIFAFFYAVTIPRAIELQEDIITSR